MNASGKFPLLQFQIGSLSISADSSIYPVYVDEKQGIHMKDLVWMRLLDLPRVKKTKKSRTKKSRILPKTPRAKSHEPCEPQS